MTSRRGENLDEAQEALVDLLREQHAVTWSEAEAKLTEESKPRESAHMAHVLTQAKQLLLAKKLITKKSAVSRGGKTPIETFSLTDTRDRTTKIADAERRKRLLTARYYGWSQGNSTYPHGLIGPGGESAVRQAIMATGNLSVTTPGAGEVPRALGIRLPGSLDSGGWLPLIDPATEQPLGLAYVPIEVKNLRDWLYPNSAEIYQLLHKAALLQRQSPATPIHPVLVTRRTNYTLFFMAKQLGFKVRDTRQQYIRDVIDDNALAEIRTELGFTDLMKVAPDKPVDNLTRFFRTVLPKNALLTAQTWRETVLNHELDKYFRILRDNTLRYDDRAEVMAELRAAAETAGLQGGW